MKIKHFAGYGCVNAKRIKDPSCTLHVQIRGNHEWGIVRNDEYDLFNWLVKRFDKSIPDSLTFHRMFPKINVVPSWDAEAKEDVCDYMFTYGEGEI